MTETSSVHLAERLHKLRQLGRYAQSGQILWAFTMGGYISTGGSQQLRSTQWSLFADFFGGYQVVAAALFVAGCIGIVGLFFFRWHRVYEILMWVFTIITAAWCFTAAGFLGYAAVKIGGGANLGLWSWTMVGLFLIFTRAAMQLATNIDEQED